MKRNTWRHGLFAGAALTALTLTMSMPASAARASPSRPTAPRSVHAIASTASAKVRWSAPASSGGSAVKSYVATSHPSSRSCTTARKSCVVKGLKAGSVYTFTVVAKNAAGASRRSRSSNRVMTSVSIASSRAHYLAAITTFNTALASAQAAIATWGASTPLATETTDLSNLQATFTAYTTALRKDKWPAAARADISSYITVVTALGKDYVGFANASSASNAALLVDTFFSDGNEEAQRDYKVRADLKMTQLITGPVASTSTAVAIGSSQTVHDFYGDALTVTMSQILDPATAGTGSGLPDAGFRFVAVEAVLSNTSSGDVGGDANLAMTVRGSDGKTYLANYATVAACTNYSYGEIDVPASGTSTGCVVFQLPTGVTVQSVSFSLDSGYLDTAVWNA